MKQRYILLAIAALAFAACARNTEPSEPEGNQVTITASQEEPAGTRTTVQDGGTQVFWEPADEIKVFFKGAGSRFVSQNTSLVSIADFTGTFSGVVGSTEGSVASNLIWGLYPYRADAVSDGGSVTTTLPAKQTGRPGSFAKNTNITLAASKGLNLAFYNVCGGLRFSLTQEGIKRVTFEGNEGETLAGKIKIAFEEGVPAVQEVFQTDSIITLTAPGGGTFQTGQWYYFSALPGTLAKGYKMVFYKETESAKLTSSSTVRFKRGTFGSLSDADEDLVFKPSGSGDEPDPDGFIQFADPVAKYACVDKFDSNHDGEVSYAEAAAATSLSGLFTDWNTVTLFDEIKYFTGVTSISGVFTGLAQLKHITVPDWITTLGSAAFEDCSALDTVALPAALSSLPTYCFNGCSALKDVTLPTGITSIPNGCFWNCASLTTVALPSTVTSLGQNAFSGCTSLTGMELPSALEYIGSYAFQNCRGVVSLVFPHSLSFVGSHAFSGCTTLASASFGDGVSLGQYAFAGCSNLSSIVLPGDMTSIPNYCFQNCMSLTTITWPESLTTIGNGVFVGCRFTESSCTLELPPSIATIGSSAFGCVRNLILPSSHPVSIASDSFVNNYSLLYVPDNLVEVYKVRTNWSSYSDMIRSISDYTIAPKPTLGGVVGEAIDLGLSVRWASWNVGSSAPEDYGAYFAWGEVSPKWEYDDYDWLGYRLCNGSKTALMKYVCQSSYGPRDFKDLLDPEDDVAHVNWGGSWRMPTHEEMLELERNCSTLLTTENGVLGCRYTSKKEGYTDKSIFLPAAGFRSGSSLNGVGSIGYYWSSCLGGSSPDAQRMIIFSSSSSSGVSFDDSSRCYGLSVRPVTE